MSTDDPASAHLLASAAATTALAERLAPLLRAGDCILLEGPVGAGKSHLARALIRALLPADQRGIDIPSPSFTLVQAYDTTAGAVWHADLYRLSDPAEVEELGLTEAFATAICLIEWPDRLGALAPADALRLQLSPAEDEEARWLRPGAGGPRSRALRAALCDAGRGHG